MSRSDVSIMNLPDEIILTIWNNLEPLDILYSFVGVNRRFHQLVRDRIYTRSMEFIKSDDRENRCSLTDAVLDRFSSDILPEVHELVECLVLEPFSIEPILAAGNYPHLQKLTLLQLDQDLSLNYFDGMKRA